MTIFNFSYISPYSLLHCAEIAWAASIHIYEFTSSVQDTCFCDCLWEATMDLYRSNTPHIPVHSGKAELVLQILVIQDIQYLHIYFLKISVNEEEKWIYLLTFCFDNHNLLFQVNWGMYQTEPRLLLLSNANSILIHKHPITVIQQSLVSYRPLCNLAQQQEKIWRERKRHINCSIKIFSHRFSLHNPPPQQKKTKKKKKKMQLSISEILSNGNRKSCACQCQPCWQKLLFSNQRWRSYCRELTEQKGALLQILLTLTPCFEILRFKKRAAMSWWIRFVPLEGKCSCFLPWTTVRTPNISFFISMQERFQKRHVCQCKKKQQYF